MEYLFIQIQHFLFICIATFEFYFCSQSLSTITLIYLILSTHMRAINVKQMAVQAVGELYLCHQLSEFQFCKLHLEGDTIVSSLFSYVMSNMLDLTLTL